MGIYYRPLKDILKRFQSEWSKLDQPKYTTGIEDENIKHKIRT